MKLKAVYTIAELSQMLGLSVFAVYRLIDRNDVRTVRLGRTMLVPLTSFARALPDLWQSILMAKGIHPTSEVECPCCESVFQVSDLRRVS